jgi:uncharacterized ion transporter superfamily protein YfcC
MILLLSIIILTVVLTDVISKASYKSEKEAIVKGANAEIDKMRKTLRIQRRKFEQLQNKI